VRSVLDRVFPLALSRPSLMRAAYSLAGGRAPDGSQLARLAREPVKLVAAARQAVGAIVAAGAAGDGFHRRKVGYHGPVHCVWGGRDRVVSVSHLDGVEAAFHRVRAHVWEEMAHQPQREAPERLVALLKRVGDGVNPRSAAADWPGRAAQHRARAA
jgi:pimeloyl-ACP methyl ester carboxylesterase